MKSVTGRRMAKLARINGSHHIYTMEGRFERSVIPIHGNTVLKVGL
jgi:predicted RNA binding protein YcfA (HicA-like mRNA interferase family)